MFSEMRTRGTRRPMPRCASSRQHDRPEPIAARTFLLKSPTEALEASPTADYAAVTAMLFRIPAERRARVGFSDMSLLPSPPTQRRPVDWTFGISI
jgi:hypothetical protein